MRRRIVFAAIVGSLVLGACSDASRQGPSESTPAFDKGVPCPNTDFPLSDANALITQLYPAGTSKQDNPQADMLAKAKDISEKWSKCKVADPQLKVVDFTNTLLNDFRSGNLVGGTTPATAALVSSLINTMYSGVGFGAPNLPVDPTTGTDFGVGFFTPGQQLLVQTNVLDGAVLIPADAFTEPTAITILLRPDAPNPFDATGFTVQPPFFEITASNLSGTHYLANGQAVVGFCVDETTLASLNQPAIAHLAVAEGSHLGGFEVLDDASAAQFASLGLDCDQFIPPDPAIAGSLFGHGFGGFASALPRVTAHYLSSAAAAVFLPRRLEAYFGKVGVGGLATSLSPFGVTDRNAAAANHFEFRLDGDPAGHGFTSTHPAEWDCGTTASVPCWPDVVVKNSQGVGIGDVPVTATLIQVGSSTGTLDLASTTVVTTNSDVSGSFDVGEALFDNLIITLDGTYRLRFSAPGVTPLESEDFTVTAPVQ